MEKHKERKDRALAVIVLAVDPSLLYLLGEPEDPQAVWKKLEEQFQRKTFFQINLPDRIIEVLLY